MDRRFFTALILCMIVLFAYQEFIMGPQIEQQRRAAEEAAQKKEAEEAANQANAANPVDQAATATPRPTAPTDPAATGPAEIPAEIVPALPPAQVVERGIETPIFSGTLSSSHGAFTSAVIKDYHAANGSPWVGQWLWNKVRGRDNPLPPGSCDPGGPVEMVHIPETPNLSFNVGRNKALLNAAGTRTLREDGDWTAFVHRVGGLELETAYGPPTEEGMIPMKLVVRNLGGGSETVQPQFTIGDEFPEAKGGMYGNVREFIRRVDGKVKNVAQTKVMKKGELEAVGAADLIGIGDRYFLMAFLTDTPGAEVRSGFVPAADGDQASGGLYRQTLRWPETTIAAGAEEVYRGALYIGPKESKTLTSADDRLKDTVSYGFFSVLSWPILGLLRFFQGLVGSWGIAIILLTLTIKLLVFPLSQKSYESMDAMKRLQPEVDALRKKHKDDPQRMNTEMMALWKEHGVNPMGGCLPMLIQLPIWFALYRVLWVSVDLYQQPFLFFCDLTEPDPWGVTPLLLMVTMVIQYRFQPAPSDPTQAMVMKFMPIFFGVIMFQLPAGLVVYILINTLLSIGQQYYIKRRFAVKNPNS